MDRQAVGTARIVRGNALALPLQDSSVDLIVTSPPYFGLRSYQDGGEHYAGQIGSEATPAEFVDALIAATAEMVRVLKPSGSIWVNLGDKYAGSDGSPDGPSGLEGGKKQRTVQGNRTRTGSSDSATRRATAIRASVGGARQKSLIGVPWRYALRCIDDLGLILRAEVIWSKPNGLPESVTDRVRRSHEQWFHFTREPRYFSAVDEIRESYDEKTAARYAAGFGSKRELAASQLSKNTDYYVDGLTTNPLGKLPGSVWTVPTQPLRVPEHLGVDHFAAFPMEWPRRIIRGWSPSGVCTQCGEGRRPIAEQTDEAYAAERARVRANRSKRTTREDGLAETFGGVGGRTNTGGFSNISNGVVRPSHAITGYTCACTEPTAPTTPATVLDPFGGTGTTALVAKALGRHGISVDMSADYCRLATWRTNDPDELARALQVDKPAKQVDGQADLFDLIEGGAA